jgi:AAA15 family ATPase/GTPase
MRIDQIKIKNFKRVKEISVDLADITYLVGGNNSGKSSVLQAIHMAVGCAQSSAEFDQQVIAEANLRYCPTGDFLKLGNRGPYENRRDGSRATIEFSGKTSDDANASYKIEIYKARNYNNVGVDRSGVYPAFGQFICDPKTLFSVYVPGLAGIPHHEEMQSYASVFRKAAGGDANLVFRNIVRLLKERSLVDELEQLLFEVVGPCKFTIIFDPDRDLYVDVRIAFEKFINDDSFVPIDLSGTGVLQITQILAYVLLFRPKMLLVDEPDSHLHPSRQVLLSAIFSRIVERYNCKIIISTHSRHLINSAPDGAKLVWIRNGSVEKQDAAGTGLTSMLLDIGALDQIDSHGADILICTEDNKKKVLEDCVGALKLEIDVKVISYNGVSNAASAEVIHSVSELFPRKPIVIIHRDRDYLIDDEINRWGEAYEKKGMRIFCPALQDIESYYVSSNHLSRVYAKPVEEISALRGEIVGRIAASMRSKFRDKRQEANLKFWRDGGSPRTEELWPEQDLPSEANIFGKLLEPRINEEFGKNFGRQRGIYKQPSTELIEELKAVIEKCIPAQK